MKFSSVATTFFAIFAAFASANDEYETDLTQRITNLRAQVRTELMVERQIHAV